MLSVLLVYSPARFTSTPPQRLKSRVEEMMHNQPTVEIRDFVVTGIMVRFLRNLRSLSDQMGSRFTSGLIEILVAASRHDRVPHPCL
jgi:hypothetical protein